MKHDGSAPRDGALPHPFAPNRERYFLLCAGFFAAGFLAAGFFAAAFFGAAFVGACFFTGAW